MNSKNNQVDVDATILDKVVVETRKDVQSCGSRCVNFLLMKNIYEPKHLFVKYTKHFFNEGNDYPRTVPRWICFNLEGDRTGCDPKFNTVSVQNDFYGKMYQVAFLGKNINDLK